MIPDLAAIVGFYVILRALSMITRRQPAEHWLTIFGALLLIPTVLLLLLDIHNTAFLSQQFPASYPDGGISTTSPIPTNPYGR